jgi:endogenous inhibitor of DNA gyrase (YacG/DUF329 family)
MKMTKRCDICNIEFETTNPRKKYCSPECGKQGAKIRAAKRRGNDIIKDCPICGERFEIGKNGALIKYCSQDCADEARRIRNRERWREANPGWDDGTNKVCEWCGKEFTVPARNAHIARFCSDKCKDTWHSRQDGRLPWDAWKVILDKQKEETKKIKEVERRARMKTKECTECGKTFETMQPNQLTCSTECSRQRSNRLKWQREEKRYNDTNLVDKDISLKVLYKRDKGICYICGGKCNFKDHTKTNGNFIAGPTYPSIDHLIPIARGGMHAWDNVKLAHHHCNAMKSDVLPNELGLDIDIDDAYALAREVSPRMKEVKQITREGKMIGIYESTAEAERQTGVKSKGIQNCARGECKTYGGYKWVYV